MKKHLEQSGFLPSPLCSSQHALLFVSVTLCFAKMVTFLVQSRACCAVVNKLSTLFGFAVHCKMRDFNISLDELLFIQVFKSTPAGVLTALSRLPAAFWCLWHLKRPLAFSSNSVLLLKNGSR